MNQPNNAELHQAFVQWGKAEFTRYAAYLNNLEGHVITYLVGVNSGGVAAVAAFSAASTFSSQKVVWALWCFLLGLFSIGVALAIGYLRAEGVTRNLGSDLGDYYLGHMSHVKVEANHKARTVKRHDVSVFGWTSFAAFIFGAILCALAFQDYMTVKPTLPTAPAAAARS